MKKVGKIWILSTLLPWFSSVLHAQDYSHAGLSASIVSPVGLFNQTADDFTTVLPSTKNSETKIKAADFLLETAGDNLFNITVPVSLNLQNKTGSSCITATIKTDEFLVMGLSSPQKSIAIDSYLLFENEPPIGKHSSSAYEITVNFD